MEEEEKSHKQNFKALKFVWNVSNFSLAFSKRASFELIHQSEAESWKLLGIFTYERQWNEEIWVERSEQLINVFHRAAVRERNCQMKFSCHFDKHKFTYFWKALKRMCMFTEFIMLGIAGGREKWLWEKRKEMFKKLVCSEVW
jgi:hypothetical protein